MSYVSQQSALNGAPVPASPCNSVGPPPSCSGCSVRTSASCSAGSVHSAVTLPAEYTGAAREETAFAFSGQPACVAKPGVLSVPPSRRRWGWTHPWSGGGRSTLREYVVEHTESTSEVRAALRMVRRGGEVADTLQLRHDSRVRVWEPRGDEENADWCMGVEGTAGATVAACNVEWAIYVVGDEAHAALCARRIRRCIRRLVLVHNGPDDGGMSARLYQEKGCGARASVLTTPPHTPLSASRVAPRTAPWRGAAQLLGPTAECASTAAAPKFMLDLAAVDAQYDSLLALLCSAEESLSLLYKNGWAPLARMDTSWEGGAAWK
ncbi:hypothetical protein MSPP1_001920 [Malassezia sp. CBS 17886]|nr:hypothetical protein MSPP1_001920 [Malassezia sp. CBS 17886]